MNFSPKRMIAGAILVVALLGLFLIIKPDDSNNGDTAGQDAPVAATGNAGADPAQNAKQAKPSPPPVPRVVISNGEPDEMFDLKVTQGDTVRFSVKSDIAEEVHVHGYDVSKEVDAGGSVRFSFPASITGVFEVELEHSAVPIATLQVNP